MNARRDINSTKYSFFQKNKWLILTSGAFLAMILFSVVESSFFRVEDYFVPSVFDDISYFKEKILSWGRCFICGSVYQANEYHLDDIYVFISLSAGI